jgi:hypothetical protein
LLKKKKKKKYLPYGSAKLALFDLASNCIVAPKVMLD